MFSEFQKRLDFYAVLFGLLRTILEQKKKKTEQVYQIWM